MAELIPQERLQPALIDRLADDEPSNQQPEPLERRLINTNRLRQAVLRDIAWLFNATKSLSSDELAPYPLCQASVLAYGLPPLAGQTASSLDIDALEVAIREAITSFEPRIDPRTLAIEPMVFDLAMDHHNVVSIQISGQLWAQPVPIELMLRTEVDLETGAIEVRELTRTSR